MPESIPWLMRKADHWLEHFCDPYLLEGIQGDLYESYLKQKKEKGSRLASMLYFFKALGFLRGSFKRKRKQNNLEAMFKNYFTATIRNLTRQKFYSGINVFGLVLGMTAGFMILQYVYHELTYDQFFENKENIFRVQTNRYNNGELSTQWAGGAAGAGYHLAENIPEVLDYVNLRRSGAEISYQEKYFQLTQAFYARENFFEVFSIPLVQGVDSTVLAEPFTVVLSESFAKKMFGSENPVGKIIKQNDATDYKVTGVFQDLPERSHMSFELLYSFKSYLSFFDEGVYTNWNWDGFHNYVVLQPGADRGLVNQKIAQVLQDQMGEEMEQRNYLIELILQPLSEIHLISNYIGEIKPTGNKKTTYFLLIIGLFVLVIAWINYINLTTARALNRAKEVGVRKVLGSSKQQLVGQFMFESFFLNTIAFVIAVGVVLLIFPIFNEFVGRSASYSWPSSPLFWVGLAGILLLGFFLSGFYPSFVLTSFRPVDVLKGKLTATESGGGIRKGLVIFQFLASAVLITGTYIVYQQMNHLRSQKLGVSIEKNLIIPTPVFSSDSISDIYDGIFRNRLQSHPDIERVTISTSVPGKQPNWNAGGIRLLTQGENETNQYRVIGCDDQFVDFYDLKIVEGRGFDKSFGSESNNILLNEKAIRQMGLENNFDAINKKVLFWGDTFNIVGVVKNYHHESPKLAYDALIFRYFESPGGMYSLKLNTQNTAGTLKTIQAEWEASFGGKIFDFEFLEDYYNRQYEAEVRFGSIFGLFSALAIIVACLGLFGLSSYMTNLRSKEVGVRKVLGASTNQLLALLTRDFMRLVGFSLVLAMPINWWLMNNWLSDFESRISLGVFTFLIPALLIVSLALCTVIYQTFKTTLLNPATTLKDE